METNEIIEVENNDVENNNNEYIDYVEYNGIYDIKFQNLIKLINNKIVNEKIKSLDRINNLIHCEKKICCICSISSICIIMIIIIVVYKN